MTWVGRLGVGKVGGMAAILLLPATRAMAQADPAKTSTDIVRETQGWVAANQIVLWVSYLAVAAVAGFLFWRFNRSEAGANMRQRLGHEMMGNWRLATLAFTSLVLTLASGWTTWDGMTNFTGTPILSFLITAGIQGVMLIAAWLIGESFAIGLAGGARPGPMSMPDKILAALSIVLLAVALYVLSMVLLQRGAIEFIDELLRRRKSELALSLPSLNVRILISLGFAALITTLVVSQKEIFQPYLRGVKAILSSLPIWLMFTACMLTSVFFSFDSLFSTIFPPAERARVAELRTTNQVAGVVGDLGATITRRQGESVEGLFRSEAWADYSGRINDIIAIARGAPDQIAALARKEMEDQQAVRAGLEERKASAESQSVRLAKRKDELLADVTKLKEEVPPLAAEVDKLKSEIFAKDSETLAKKAEMQAEAGGVGGTLKAGQGPEWSKRRKELDDIAKLRAIIDSQLKERSAQLKERRGRLGAAELELAQIDGEIGKLRGEKDVADRQMAQASAEKPEGSIAAATQKVTASGVSSLDEAFAQFRQRPERASFDAIQTQCAALITVFDKVPTLKAAAADKGIRCDPSVVADPVARVFALNDGVLTFKARCAKPDSLPTTGTDALLDFANQCVQSSGLDSKDTALFRSNINSVGLNRDDKAHRFVVSWNAFLDGNRLAYLALAIAFALDLLVFMSGLFGANATSSPLVRLPNATKRSASDLESSMFAALRPDIYGSAKLVIDGLHPIVPRDGFVSEIRTRDFDRETGAAIRRVLSAGAQFGAVEPDAGRDGVFMVRGELTEFLAKACERELRSNPAVREQAERARAVEATRHAKFEEQRQAEAEKTREKEADQQKDRTELEKRARALEPVLTAALIPDDLDDGESLFHSSQRMLAEMRPTLNNYEFTSELDLTGMVPAERQFCRGILNAAAACRAVEKKDTAHDSEVYLIRPEMTLALTAIRVKAYEDWQRRSRRQQGMFGWLLGGPRDVTPALQPRTSGRRANLQVIEQTAGERVQGALGQALRLEPPGAPRGSVTPLPKRESRGEADAPAAQPARRDAPPAPAATVVAEPVSRETLLASSLTSWARRHAYSEPEAAWLRQMLDRGHRQLVLGMLADFMAPGDVDAATAEAQHELPAFVDSHQALGLDQAARDDVYGALVAVHQLQNLRSQLNTALDRHAANRQPGPDQLQLKDALRDTGEALNLLTHNPPAAFDLWRRATAAMRAIEERGGRQRRA